MFRKLFFIGGLALASAATATPAAAQSGPVGQWNCRTANQTTTNNGFENWMY